jgi:D-glycero-D-manno-heptose 1,7-bisphosphate phosphatase
MKKAVFLDRDGVINRRPAEGQYVTCWEELHLLPGVAEAIALLVDEAYSVVVVSNQRCVAKGLLTQSELESIHARMRGILASAGAFISAIYYCPHELHPPCSCRKPAPGMLLTAAHEHEIDLSESWMIGDSETDIEAGKNAGCRTIRIRSLKENECESPDLHAESLLDAARQILGR